MTDSLQALAEQHLDLELTDQQAAQLQTYADQLLEWNQRMNLTAITEPEAVRIKHLLDALTVLTLPDLPQNARVIDVGTGGGVPGIPLAIARPDWFMLLLESTGKKVKFLQHVTAMLGLQKVTAIHARAEDAGQDTGRRETYDLVVARAVARLPVLVEYLLPFCKIGGRCIAMKGETAYTEADDAAYALEILGGEVTRIQEIQLPGIEQTHYLIDIRKVRKTPKHYPRRAGTPNKEPLEKP